MTYTTFTYHQYHVIRITWAHAQAASTLFHEPESIFSSLTVTKGVWMLDIPMAVHMCRLPSKLAATLARQY